MPGGFVIILVHLAASLHSVPTRRTLLRRAAALVLASPAAGARGGGANWLTSEPLEQLRKLEQEAADAKYGELAPINDGRGGGQRLVPILKLQARIARLTEGAREPSRWPAMRVELADRSMVTKQMKRDFNVSGNARGRRGGADRQLVGDLGGQALRACASQARARARLQTPPAGVL